jgi:hypothetical protein
MLRMSEKEYERLQASSKTDQREATKPAKPSKYRNVKTTMDGITFDSAKEARRYQQLKLLELAGQIEALMRQTRFVLTVNGEWIADYIADFSYIGHGELIVEDTKSPITRKLPAYAIKKRLMFAVFGHRIYET